MHARFKHGKNVYSIILGKCHYHSKSCSSYWTIPYVAFIALFYLIYSKFFRYTKILSKVLRRVTVVILRIVWTIELLYFAFVITIVKIFVYNLFSRFSSN